MKSGSEYWRQVEDLYHKAVECNEFQRQSLLDRECAGNDELRREVEALLAGHERAKSFMEEAPVERLMAGVRLSTYEIVAHIGSGGMGDVYRARDTKLNRPVAIKFLSADLADASARRRFQREAQMASSLNHPHILTVHDTGEFEGQQYLVTEFVDGFTLREWARHERPSSRRIVDLAIGIADALASAHQAGILHRDIKPENILVSKSNHAKVVDFGLAKVIDPEDPRNAKTRWISKEMTRAGIIVGTVAYMSPEQAAGRPVDARSDVFAFGAVLYELLAGRRPFEGDSDMILLHAIQYSPLRPLAEMRPDIPGELRNLVEKALEKDTADRYQSMREMVVDLKRIQRMKSGEVLTPAAADRPVPAIEVPREWSIPPQPVVSSVSPIAIDLLGRDAEMATIQDVWEKTQAGQRQLILIAGEPGIGKTRLALEFARRCRATVLLGRCDQEALVPYQPFVEALEWYVRTCPVPVLRQQASFIEALSEL